MTEMEQAIAATHQAGWYAKAWTRASFAFSGSMAVWFLAGLTFFEFPPPWFSLSGLLVISIGTIVSSHRYTRRMREMVALAKRTYGESQ